MRSTRLSFLAASALSLTLAAPATAQEAPPSGVTATTDDGQVVDVVVTAQRREEKLKDVPVSVGVIEKSVLEAVNSGGADIRALAGRVPSLNVESSFGRTFPRFYIRGLGNTDFDLNASQPVSLVYDDVVLENPILKGFPAFDVKAVEVLRGPQGTLFGRNTPAGIVKFDSVRPFDDDNQFRLSLGTKGTMSGEFGNSVRLSDSTALRLSGLVQLREDYVDNLATPRRTDDLEGYTDLAFRGQLELRPSSALNVRLSLQARDYDGSARVFRANALAKGSNRLVGIGGGAFDRGTVWQDGTNFQTLSTRNGSATVDYDFGPATLTSVTAYWDGSLESRGDIDGGFGNAFSPVMGPGFIPFSAQSQDNVPSLEQFTQEVRIASNNGLGLGYQAGLFYFDEKLDITSFDFGSPTDRTPSAIATQRQSSKAKGAFASLRYKSAGGLTLQAGARYNDDSRDMLAARPTDTRPGFLGFGGPVADQRASVSDSLVTWDASALQELTPSINVFARVAKGYRAPSIQGRLLFGRDLSVADSEKTMSYEAGIKSQLLANRLRFNLTGYRYDTSDMQLTAVGGASNFTRLINAAKVRGHGFEAELSARPATGLSFGAGLGYNKSRIDDPALFVAGCGANCTVLDAPRPGAPGIYSIDGNALPQSPKWSYNLNARYETPIGAGTGYVSTDWVGRSRIQFFLYDSVEFSDDRMLEGGLRLGYKWAGKELALFGRNILDDQSAVSGIDFNNLTAMVNEPRVLGAEFAVRF